MTWPISTRGFVFAARKPLGRAAWRFPATRHSASNPFPAIWRTECRPNTERARSRWWRAFIRTPLAKHGSVTDLLGAGDIDRIIIECGACCGRLRMRRNSKWPAWSALSDDGEAILNRNLESPPPLPTSQRWNITRRKRVEHRDLVYGGIKRLLAHGYRTCMT